MVADTVAAPIEQQVNGVEKMLYMTSQSNNDGSYTLDVTFEIGTDVNMAQVLVQNRVAIAEPSLPDVVQGHRRDHQEAVGGHPAVPSACTPRTTPRPAGPITTRST